MNNGWTFLGKSSALGKIQDQSKTLILECVVEILIVIVPVLEEGLGGVALDPLLGGDITPRHPPGEVYLPPVRLYVPLQSSDQRITSEVSIGRIGRFWWMLPIGFVVIGRVSRHDNLWLAISNLYNVNLPIALWANHLRGWCIFWNWPLSGLQGVEVCAGLLQSMPRGAAECVQGYRVCAGCSFNILPCSSRLNQKIF